jgi:hypothetical protein
MRHNKLQGSDLHAPTNEIVENNTGSLITKLSCTTFDSIGNLYPQIRLASGGIDTVRGIVQADIGSSSTGYITCLGFLANCNTNLWNPGTRLYCDPVGQLSTSILGLPVCVVLKKSATAGVIYAVNTGVKQDDLLGVTFPPNAELEFLFALAYPNTFREFSYGPNDDVVDFDVYESSAKLVHIFNKHFSYDVNLNLSTIVTTNLLSGLSKTRTITYGPNGNMISTEDSV